MIVRLVLLLLVVGAAFLAVAGFERLPRRAALPGLGAGLTVVTGAGCVICPAAVRAIAAVDPGLAVRVMDRGDLADASIRSVPTAIVTDRGGAVVLRRSGRSVVTDAAEIARVARSVS
jgi:hypothetical protein